MFMKPLPAFRGFGDSALLPPQPAAGKDPVVPALVGLAIGAFAGFLFSPGNRGAGLGVGAAAGGVGGVLFSKYGQMPSGAPPPFIGESMPGMPGAILPGTPVPSGGAPVVPASPEPPVGGDGGKTFSNLNPNSFVAPSSPPPAAAPATVAARVVQPALSTRTFTLFTDSPATFTIGGRGGATLPPRF